jgi:hypothetical protein
VTEYRYRTETCETCGGAGEQRFDHIDGHGTGYSTGGKCFDCSGESHWEAACADCDEVKPLNTDGVCRECALLWLVEVEHGIAPDNRNPRIAA